MPPSAFEAVATLAPTAVMTEPPRVAVAVAPAADAHTAAARSEAAPDPVRACDLSTTCPQCASEMRPEHAHYRCPACGYRDSCCF